MKTSSFDFVGFFNKKPTMVLYGKTVDVSVFHFGRLYSDFEGCWGAVSVHVSSPWRLRAASGRMISGPTNDSRIEKMMGRSVAESERKHLAVTGVLFDSSGRIEFEYDNGYMLVISPKNMSKEWYRFVYMLPGRPSVHRVFPENLS